MKKLFLLLISSFAFGQAPNYFYTTLISGITSTDTIVTFTASDTTFAGNNTNYYATIYDSRYENPSVAYKAGYAEAVLIQSRTANTFEIERAKFGTSAKNFNVSGRRYKIVVAPFSTHLYNHLSDTISSHSDTMSSHRIMIDSTAQNNFFVIGSTQSSSITAGSTRYTTFYSTGIASAVGTLRFVLPAGTYVLSDFNVGHIISGGSNGTLAFTLCVGGVETAMTATSTSSDSNTWGFNSDTSTSITLTASDSNYLSVKLVAASANVTSLTFSLKVRAVN